MSRAPPVEVVMLCKTKMCKYFAKGRCKRGQACTWAHGEEELMARPDLFRTQLCVDFAAVGKCQSGGQCRFAHGSDMLRPVAVQLPGPLAPPAVAAPAPGGRSGLSGAVAAMAGQAQPPATRKDEGAREPHNVPQGDPPSRAGGGCGGGGVQTLQQQFLPTPVQGNCTNAPAQGSPPKGGVLTGVGTQIRIMQEHVLFLQAQLLQMAAMLDENTKHVSGRAPLVATEHLSTQLSRQSTEADDGVPRMDSTYGFEELEDSGEPWDSVLQSPSQPHAAVRVAIIARAPAQGEDDLFEAGSPAFLEVSSLQ